MLIGYQETLDIVESFLAKTGIKSFCTIMCKGECCRGYISGFDCYNSSHSCFKNEGLRLPCSIYLCLPLREALFNKDQSKIYTKVRREIVTKVKSLMEEVYDCSSINPYFNVNSEKVQKRFTIEQALVTELFDLDLESINQKIKWLENRIIEQIGKDLVLPEGQLFTQLIYILVL